MRIEQATAADRPLLTRKLDHVRRLCEGCTLDEVGTIALNLMIDVMMMKQLEADDLADAIRQALIDAKRRSLV
jgi:hypothetical protein